MLARGRSTKNGIWLSCSMPSRLRRGTARTSIREGGGIKTLYLTLHCHLQNDSCIKIIMTMIVMIIIIIMQYNKTLLPSVNTLIARGMFCGAKYTHHTFTPIIKHLITTTANKHQHNNNNNNGHLERLTRTGPKRLHKMMTGSAESHFNVSLIVRDKVTRRCPQTTTFEEKGELKRNRTDVPLLTSLTPYC